MARQRRVYLTVSWLCIGAMVWTVEGCRPMAVYGPVEPGADLFRIGIDEIRLVEYSYGGASVRFTHKGPAAAFDVEQKSPGAATRTCRLSPQRSDLLGPVAHLRFGQREVVPSARYGELRIVAEGQDQPFAISLMPLDETRGTLVRDGRGTFTVRLSPAALSRLLSACGQ